MPNRQFRTWTEALRLLNECFRDSKDRRDRALFMAHIAQIELLRDNSRKLEDITAAILAARKEL